MEYGNRPQMPKKNYENFGGFNNKSKFQNNKKGSNSYKQNKKFDNNYGFSFKDKDEDEYAPKTYAKKPKEKTFFDDIIIPEYEMEKQKMRDKRRNDQKYKNKRNVRDY